MVYLLPTYEPWMSGSLVYPDAFWRADAAGLTGVVEDTVGRVRTLGKS